MQDNQNLANSPELPDEQAEVLDPGSAETHALIDVPEEPVVLEAVEEAPKPALQPVRGKERYEILDMLRGLALFGILMANMRGFNVPEALYFDINRYFNMPFEQFTQGVVNALFQGKFISLFSFMFGLGFAVQFTRGTEQGRAFGGWFSRHPRLAFGGIFLGILGVPVMARVVASKQPLPQAIGIGLATTLVCWGLYLIGFRKMSAGERDFVGFFSKRLTLLYLIGWAHVALFWWGDVLTQYAVAGFVLLLFRNRRPKTIAIWAWAITLLPVLVVTGMYIASVVSGKPMSLGGGGGGPTGGVPYGPGLVNQIRLYSTGGYDALVLDRLKTVWDFTPFIQIGVMVSMLPCFLLGLYVWKKGIVKHLEDWLPAIRKVWLWTSLAFVIYTVFGYILPAVAPLPKGDFSFLSFLRVLSRNALTPFVALFYLTSFVLATRTDAIYRFFQPCAAIGKTCLSNYLLQSAIGMLLFTSTGLGLFGHGVMLFGKVGPTWDFFVTIVVYLLQIPLSVWYLRHFQMGPVEWVWRSLAYGKAQPFRRELRESTA